MIFRLENNVTKKRYEFNVEDIGDSQLFYHFNMSLSDTLDDGEFTYWLYDDEATLLATGLAQVGDYTVPSGSTATYHQTSGTTYIQYQGSI